VVVPLRLYIGLVLFVRVLSRSQVVRVLPSISWLVRLLRHIIRRARPRARPQPRLLQSRRQRRISSAHARKACISVLLACIVCTIFLFFCWLQRGAGIVASIQFCLVFLCPDGGHWTAKWFWFQSFYTCNLTRVTLIVTSCTNLFVFFFGWWTRGWESERCIDLRDRGMDPSVWDTGKHFMGRAPQYLGTSADTILI